MRLSLLSPAKLNLFLAITGRRTDGFHDLVSVATPVAFGDDLVAELREGRDAEDPAFTLTCDCSAVPVDGSNLILKAATAFAEVTGWGGRVAFHLTKRTPMGAGLGGGSSNATTALQALNTLAGNPLPAAAMRELAARIGSDCVLFLHGGPVVMRGRGERIEPIADRGRLIGREVLIFKPGFAISTAWAYGRLAAENAYLPAAEAEARLAAWMGSGEAPAEDLLLNTMEGPAFAKFPALPLLLERLRSEFGLVARMSGSGSACFALLSPTTPRDRVQAVIREAWGHDVFLVTTRIVG
ncbi:4-(cytidine 5'-diphospho)-2-C-methyl-D-erythritol kinase [Opitutaceae bacterium]